MKKVLLVLSLAPLVSWAQQDDAIPDYTPKWSLHMDLFNFQANYPAVLFSLERQLDENFSIHQELGPVLAAETYDGSEFDDYRGFKGRTEFRLYMSHNDAKQSRTFVGVDFAYEIDQYVLDYRIDFDNFSRIESGTVWRSVIGTHIRAGVQRVFGERMLLDYSVGVGRAFYKLHAPDGFRDGFGGATITTDPSLGPYSMNVRLKVGFILSKLAKY